MITVRSQDKLYRFPDDTPQDVMKGAIDKHIMSFQSIKGTSAITGNTLEQPFESHEAGQEGITPFKQIGQGAVNINRSINEPKTYFKESLGNLAKQYDLTNKTPEEMVDVAMNISAPFGITGKGVKPFLTKIIDRVRFADSVEKEILSKKIPDIDKHIKALNEVAEEIGYKGLLFLRGRVGKAGEYSIKEGNAITLNPIAMIKRVNEKGMTLKDAYLSTLKHELKHEEQFQTGAIFEKSRIALEKEAREAIVMKKGR